MGAGGEQSFSVDQFGQLRVFSGEVRRVVDDKNRLNIPSRWRDPRQQELHALPERNQNCLQLLTSDELLRMKTVIDESTQFSPAQKKKFRRLWFSRATPCPIDKQGRIVLPPEIQNRFRFDGEVVLVGACECIEVWRPEEWNSVESDESINVDDMASQLGF